MFSHSYFCYVSEKADYTIVFAGITGVGKSAAGNFLLNKKDMFSTEGGLLAVTDICSAATSTICGKTVKIIDTPGFFDGVTPTEEEVNELSRALTLAKDGIHAVAFVMNNNRYTSQCEKAIQQLHRFKGLQPFMFVILTHAKNKGITKVETDEYIQQTLSNHRCPSGLKNLLEMFENRVIMLESIECNTEDYYKQKVEEFMELVETLHKSNGYKVYVNSMLHYTAQVYEKAKLQQKTEIREKTKTLQLNSEKLEQLKKQTDDITSAESKEGAKKVIDEVVALEDENKVLEKRFVKIKDELYPEKLTIWAVAKVIEQFTITIHIGDQIPQKDEIDLVMLSRHLIGLLYNKDKGATGAVVGAGIGAAFGLIVPGTNIKYSVSTGIQIGELVGNLYEPMSVVYDKCKQQ